MDIGKCPQKLRKSGDIVKNPGALGGGFWRGEYGGDRSSTDGSFGGRCVYLRGLFLCWMELFEVEDGDDVEIGGVDVHEP